MAANQSGTFAYAPDIACSIYTMNNGVLDVSQDIIDITITRNINAVSQMNMDLANPGKKYNRVINTMDRIVVFLKRTDWVQVFTGYVTFAPIETLIPTSVTISADCTIRIMQNTYWDDTLQQFQSLLLNNQDYAAAGSNATLNDGGVAQAMVNLLVSVCGWNPDNIHIQGIPDGLLTLASKAYNGLVNGIAQNSIAELAQILSSASYIAGNSTSTGSMNGSNTQPLTSSGQPAGTEFTANYAQAFYTHPIGNGGKTNFPGRNPNNPVDLDRINQDIYWASIPFTYSTFTTNSGGQIDKAKRWIAQNHGANNWDGRPILVSNINTNRVVALRATSLIQEPNTHDKHNQAVVNNDIANINYIQVHPGVAAYLAGNDIPHDDPKKFDVYHSAHPPSVPIVISWADEGTVTTMGPQTQISQNTATAQQTLGGTSAMPSTPVNYETAQQAVIAWAVSQTGAQYSQGGAGGSKDVYNGKTQGRESPKGAGSPGYFDCSGLVQWAYSKIGITIGGWTVPQWGTGSSADNATCGTFIPKNVQPQPGDLLFWDVPSDSGQQPAHVTMLSQSFNGSGQGMMMAANTWHMKAGQQSVNWNDIKNGGGMPGWGMTYMGARRPLDKLTPGKVYTFPQTTNVSDNSQGTNPTNAGSSMLSLTTSFNMLFNPPTFDPRASIMVGTPRAFLLDNNVLSDFQQIVGAGLRSFMSAPNGDFVAWFPDYYGFYGTDPVLDISPVEIVDFQIYHDDNQLVTHYGIVGDTNGIGQQVSIQDYLTTNGIVSIEDGSTMNLLFGKLSNGQTYANNAVTFLQRYGMRPMTQEQNMIHSHSMEYIYALTGFMSQWVNQYASTISLTFMPELFPGMRVTMTIDDPIDGSVEYQFYCTGVTHQCSRSSGFTTQATFTAPVKIVNGTPTILDYGLNIV
jgi:cell wall-associated NlpC family hydrolase